MGKQLADIFAKHGVTLPEDELAHFGVPGMKWGRRKKSSSSDSDGEAKPEKPEKPDVKKMTDAELKSAITRLKMEQEFTKLTAPEVSRGRKIVSEILLDVGKQQAKNYLNKNIEKLMTDTAKDASKELLKAAAKKTVAKTVQRQVVQLSKRPGF